MREGVCVWRGGGFTLDLFMEAGDLTSGSPLIILYQVLCCAGRPKRHWRQATFYYPLPAITNDSWSLFCSAQCHGI